MEIRGRSDTEGIVLGESLPCRVAETQTKTKQRFGLGGLENQAQGLV